jgi:4-amino-4-deoxy-L-arabinose transferase-like glycosyltransferase
MLLQLATRLQTVLLHRLFLPLLLGFFVLVRICVAVTFPVAISSDSFWYVSRALEMIDTGGYVDLGVPTAYWPVGYPFILSCFLRLTENPLVAGIAVNLLAGLASVFALLWIGRRLSGREDMARGAVLLLAVYPAHILYTGQLLTEPVYIAVLLLAFGLLATSRSWKSDLAAGIVFGLATYIKAQTYLYPLGLIVALVLVYRAYTLRRALVAAVAVYIGLFAVVLPWSFRNMQTFGTFVMVSTNGGPTLFDGNNPLSTGGYSGFPLGPRYEKLLPTLPILPPDYSARQVEWDALTRKMAVGYIKENPGRFVAAMPRKFWLLWSTNTDALYAFDTQYAAHGHKVMAAKLVNLAAYLLIILGALWTAGLAMQAIARRDDNRAWLGLLYTFPVFISLIAIVFSGQSRFNLPSMPFLMLAVAWLALHRLPAIGKTA